MNHHYFIPKRHIVFHPLAALLILNSHHLHPIKLLSFKLFLLPFSCKAHYHPLNL